MPRHIQDYFFRRCIGSGLGGILPGEVPEKNTEKAPIGSKKRKRANEPPEPRKKSTNDNVISTVGPSKEDESDIILDLDGWQHIIRDDEDMEFLRQSLKDVPDAPILGSLQEWALEEKIIKEHYHDEVGVSRTTRSPIKPTVEGYYVPNKSGCARTEGYYKIPPSEKVKYLRQYAKARQSREKKQAKHALGNTNASPSASERERLVKQTKSESKSSLISARAHRRNQRLFARDMTAQLAILNNDSDTGSFNQLRKRMKRLKFSRSAIHGWGLFTEEKILANDMIIEYVGEIISNAVSDKRERKYVKSGIGSCYMFKLDDKCVIDATQIGGMARLINHSCMPNTDCRKVKVDGRQRLVLYASQDVGKGRSFISESSQSCH
ncbi:histone methyltransferase set1 [Peltigera leucophlebia]|nr:histone methyltransferase set1 [Peltigera leucophlebia]